MKLYGLSGLGADERAFQKLKFDVEFIPINWLKPEPNETLNHYAKRLSDQIDVSEPFVLLGVSFGGMLACELNKFVSPKLTILLSSASTRKELPRYFHFVRFFRLHEMLPASWYKPPAWLMNWHFRLKKNQSRSLVKEIMQDADPDFLKWAIGAIMRWDNTMVPKNLLRIHGANDRVLINRKIPGTITTGKGHLILFDEARKVSETVNSRITKVLTTP